MPFLELDRRDLFKALVRAPRVVPTFNEFAQSLSGLGVVLERGFLKWLVFERRERAFGPDIILAIADAADQRRNIGAATLFAEVWDWGDFRHGRLTKLSGAPDEPGGAILAGLGLRASRSRAAILPHFVPPSPVA